MGGYLIRNKSDFFRVVVNITHGQKSTFAQGQNDEQ